MEYFEIEGVIRELKEGIWLEDRLSLPSDGDEEYHSNCVHEAGKRTMLMTFEMTQNIEHGLR